MELSTDNITSPINYAHNEVTVVQMTKTINASIEQVFDAWKTPHQLKLWWGPEGVQCPVAVVDFRIGGKYLIEMRKDSADILSSGTYEEIFPYRMLVFTDQFDDILGNSIEGYEFSFVTVRFKPIGKTKTEITLSLKGVPENFHDDCEKRWSSSLEKLKFLLEH